MRSGKELILASKAYTQENRSRSWFETIITLVLLVSSLFLSFVEFPLVIRIVLSTITALLYVRIFVIYHDYQHHAILQKSKLATLIMKTVGLYLLTPQNIWKRSHDHHHSHNSKLTLSGIGSYPTISKRLFVRLSKKNQFIYLLNRHPITILLGYFTLFIYWLNVKSFYQSPKKHWDSFWSLVLHLSASVLIFYFLGATTFFVSWLFPFFVAFAIGSYLFYCQHNFPGAQYAENQDWKYDEAALFSTSFMVMNPIMQWMTGNIGFHHVHHLNSRIPFYRLPEVMKEMPELQHAIRTSWNPIDVWNCMNLKLWDAENKEMITLKQLRRNKKNVKTLIEL
ncbi:MAG: fatty acid desaturase [Cytophagia bacterium]|nr:MAG: fatty acid desaturase [Cytophagia bacterium]